MTSDKKSKEFNEDQGIVTLEENNVIEDSVSQQIELSESQFLLILIGLLFTSAVAGIDVAIIVTIASVIATDLNGFNDIAWVAAAYYLTSNSFQLLYGKFSGIFGRKYSILSALFIFLIGCILSGVSTSIAMLVIARAIAGIGGGGLMTLCSIIVADLAPLKNRSKYMRSVKIVYNIGSILGGVLGGVFVHALNWRWCFYFDTLICIIAMVIIFFFLKLPSNNQDWKLKLKRIDYLGCITLFCFTTLLTLALNWGGQEYAWNSASVIVPLVISLLFLIAFIYTQLKVSKEPIIPVNILVRNVNVFSVTAFCNGAVFFALVYYIPLYSQLKKSESSLTSTVSMMPLIGGLIAFFSGSGIIISRIGKYGFFFVLGSIISLVGSILISIFVSYVVDRTLIHIFTAMIGAGIGLCMQSGIMATHAAVEKKDVPVITLLIRFAFSLGGVIGIGVLGAVYQNVSFYSILKHSDQIDLSKLNNGVKYISTLSPELREIVVNGYVDGFQSIFFASSAFFAVGFISSLFFKHIP